MNPDKIQERFEVALREAQALEESISLTIGKSDEHCERILRESLRSRLIKEIDLNLKPIMDRVNAEEIRLNRDLTMVFDERVHEYFPAKVWVIFFKREMSYTYAVKLLSCKSEELIAKEEEKKGFTRYTSSWEFRNRIRNLISLIEEGKLDDILKWNGAEVIWEIMGYKGKLIPKIST